MEQRRRSKQPAPGRRKRLQQQPVHDRLVVTELHALNKKYIYFDQIICYNTHVLFAILIFL